MPKPGVKGIKTKHPYSSQSKYYQVKLKEKQRIFSRGRQTMSERDKEGLPEIQNRSPPLAAFVEVNAQKGEKYGMRKRKLLTPATPYSDCRRFDCSLNSNSLCS